MFKFAGVLILLVGLIAFTLPRWYKNYKNKNFLKQLTAYLSESLENQRAYIAENVGHQIRMANVTKAIDFSSARIALPTDFNLIGTYTLSPQELLIITQYVHTEVDSGRGDSLEKHLMSMSYLLKYHASEQKLEIIGEYPSGLVEKNINSAFAQHVISMFA